MSEESHHLVELITRLLRPEEIAIVNAISKGKWMADDLVRLKVVDIDNGGMGGVRVVHGLGDQQRFGSEIGRASYIDSDGIEVNIAVNIDLNDNFMELDFWKVDFSPLLSFPKQEELWSIA